MPKCIFDKKSYTKGYRRCEITGQFKRYRCKYRWFSKPCKHFKMSLWGRFLVWLDRL